MSTQEAVWEFSQRLPDIVTADEIMDDRYASQKIAERLRQLDEAQDIPHDEATRRLM